MISKSKSALLFPKAAALHQAGNLQQAGPIYREILAAEPGNVDVLHMFGLLLLQRGEWQESAQIMRNFLKMRPHHADTLNNLGYALQNLDRDKEALDCYDQALKRNPAHAAAWYNRGNLLQKMQRYDEAVSSYRQALAIRPNHADTCVNLGNTLKQMQRYDEALTYYEQAIALAPQHAVAHNNLGNTLKELMRYDEALVHFKQALSLNPRYADAYFNAALALQELKHYSDALAHFDRAIQLNPDNAKAYACKGSLLIELGRMNEAEPSLQKAVELDPNESVPLAALLSLKRYQGDDPHLKQLEALYARQAALPQDEQILLNFAMGKAWESLGRYDDAFTAYAEGNRLHHTLKPFDEARDLRSTARTSAFFSRALFQKCAVLEAKLPPVHDERVPVFIVGMPRSGTTLIEQILSSHPSLFGAGELSTLSELAKTVELPPLDAPDWESHLFKLRELGQEYLDRVWKLAPGARFITDKMPHNFQHLGLIQLMLPNARIIHSMRDAMDSCFSCFAMKFKDGHEYCYDFDTLGRHYLRYRQLMQHWHDVLPPGRILDVRYEDTVADLEGQAKRLLDYIGLPWDPACLNFHENKRTVSTASVTQVRKPIYTSSVARWKHFEKHLGPLIEIVASQPETDNEHK